MNTRRGMIPLYCAIAFSSAASLLVALAIQPVPTLVIPVLVSALPLLARTHKAAESVRWGAVGLLLIWVVLGMASVGIFFVPALAAMVVAADRARKSRA